MSAFEGGKRTSLFLHRYQRIDEYALASLSASGAQKSGPSRAAASLILLWLGGCLIVSSRRCRRIGTATPGSAYPSPAHRAGWCDGARCWCARQRAASPPPHEV